MYTGVIREGSDSFCRGGERGVCMSAGVCVCVGVDVVSADESLRKGGRGGK